jgi:tetratricopeptide (TPR) repeat protein
MRLPSWRGHGNIIGNKVVNKQINNIPSANEFIQNLKSKYNRNGSGKPKEPTPELDVMSDWLKEKRRELDAGEPDKYRVDATLTIDRQSGTVSTTFTEYLERGISFYDKGRFKESVEFFGRALKLNPRHREALRYLLKAFYFTKMRSKGIAV